MEPTILAGYSNSMTAKRPREIVIEFERVELIRKRARVELRCCSGCRETTDVVSHAEAAELFEIAPAALFQFIRENDCHYDVGWNGKIYLCIVSLLERMRHKDTIRRLVAGGE